eukprot:TRINITY_DN55729_c0_g1_i1.p2 TRINITY_DN55729_c0_g1~~TRINITY_DN55729_c0_g1_i1.p2  ORF type:complete len:235 (-),score=-7.59 TRINITY_DN55729_c0_g1_i1:64-768(-)
MPPKKIRNPKTPLQLQKIARKVWKQDFGTSEVKLLTSKTPKIFGSLNFRFIPKFRKLFRNFFQSIMIRILFRNTIPFRSNPKSFGPAMRPIYQFRQYTHIHKFKCKAYLKNIQTAYFILLNVIARTIYQNFCFDCSNSLLLLKKLYSQQNVLNSDRETCLDENAQKSCDNSTSNCVYILSPKRLALKKQQAYYEYLLINNIVVLQICVDTINILQRRCSTCNKFVNELLGNLSR